VGTCLEIDELRELAPEMGLGDPSQLSDYEIHTRFVGHAAEKGPVSQRMQGLLDRQYRGALRRYRRLREGKELRRQWRTDVAEGRIAGAFWALVSHPATPLDLAYEVYGEIHMLSHKVGAGVRAEQRRVAELERDNRQLREQQQRAEARANEHLAHKQRVLEERDRWRDRALQAENRQQQLADQLAGWQQGRRAEELRHRIRWLENQLVHQKTRAERAEQRAAEAAEAPAPEPEAPQRRTAAQPPARAGDPRPDLGGRRVLCVGGRKGISDQYRRVVEQANGRFLHHDGGLEQGSEHLEQMLASADQVVCPVDCVGHQAVRCVKEHCKRAGTPCRFLESASVSALSRALPQLAPEAGGTGGSPAPS
jgi:hypothetical protein